MRNLRIDNIAAVCFTALILCFAVRLINVRAQSGCPGYTQKVTNSGALTGMFNEAQINVSLFNNWTVPGSLSAHAARACPAAS